MIIEIIASPPRTLTPAHIHDQWVGMKLTVATAEELSNNQPLGWRKKNRNADKFWYVSQALASKAFRKANKFQAFNFWNPGADGKYIKFPKNVCRILGE